MRLPYAWGGPLGSGEIRHAPEDFRVSEQLSFSASGAGEHLLIQIRKSGHNTRWVAKRLAEIANIPYRAVSFAGLKDRHALTEQWFGLHLAGRPDPNISSQLPDGVEIVAMTRHHRKLRQGQVKSNHFQINIRQCEFIDTVSLPEKISERIRSLAMHGVPNYFGPQRFGRNLANLEILGSARELRGLNRETRSFALSALRSGLFNGYLAERVRRDDWTELLEGEVAQSGSPRGPAETGLTHPMQQRLPSGLLWGRGDLASGGIARELELEFFGRFPDTTAILESAGAKASRRVLHSRLTNLQWSLQGDTLTLEFALGSGAYATAVLREVLAMRDHTGDRQVTDATNQES